jgi:hypothetical protein
MMARSRWVLLSVLLVGPAAPLPAIGGCNPEYEVYSTARCSQDADCGAFNVCEDQLCQPCEVLYDRCTALCPLGWELTPARRGDCRICACRDGAASGIGGEYVGGSAAWPAGGGGAGLGSTGGGGSPAGGASTAGGGASGGCQLHGDCPVGTWCDHSVCSPCSKDPALDCEPCAPPDVASFALVNECEVCQCLPPSECVDDDTCAPGICIAGPLCQDGCPDLQCCYGNTCIMP